MNAESGHGMGPGVQDIEEVTIVIEGRVDGAAAVAGNPGAAVGVQQGQRAVGRYGIAGHGAAAGVGGVCVAAVACDDDPAGGRLVGRG